MDSYTKATLRALVDAIIPATVQYERGLPLRWIVGAAGLSVEDFVIKQLDHSQFVPVNASAAGILPLSLATASLLDIGAAVLKRAQSKTYGSKTLRGAFASLPRMDRLRAIALINRLAIPLFALPLPYQNNPGLVLTMMDSLHQLTVFGYYSEWYGYGSTRLLPANKQRVEFFPPGWRFAGYSGPSYGYRAYRGYVLAFTHREGGQSK